MHDGIIALLKARFGPIPREVTRNLEAVLDGKRLIKLNVLAGQCEDIAAFREALLS
jgi:hypothetical protein